jgi:hypothetical protein
VVSPSITLLTVLSESFGAPVETHDTTRAMSAVATARYAVLCLSKPNIGHSFVILIWRWTNAKLLVVRFQERTLMCMGKAIHFPSRDSGWKMDKADL